MGGPNVQNENSRSKTNIVFRASTEADAIVEERAKPLETLFRRAPMSAVGPMVFDTRPMHKALFADLAPALPAAAGTYRGAVGTELELARREVRVANAPEGTKAKDLCVEPADVADEMARLSTALTRFWQHPPSPETAPAIVARFTWWFFHIHPYLDGNGHIWRLVFIGMARQANLRATKNWSVHERPYGVEFSTALQIYPSSPKPLVDLVSRYLRPS